MVILMRTMIRTYTIVLLVLISLWSEAQDFVVKTYSVQNSLPGNSVCGISESKKGYLWLVFFDGKVGKFDGKRYIPLELPPTGIKGQVVNLFEDSKESLWLCSSTGLLLFSKGQFTNLELPHNFSTHYVSFAGEDRKGNIWIGGMGFVAKFHYTGALPVLAGFYKFLDAKLIAENMVQDKEGKIFFSTYFNSVYTIDESNGSLKSALNELTIKFNRPPKIIKLNGGKAALYDGKNIYSLNGRKNPSLEVSLPEYAQGNIHCNESEVYYNAGELKIFFRQKRSGKEREFKTGVKPQYCYAFVSDKVGNVWVAHDKGLTRISKYSLLPVMGRRSNGNYNRLNIASRGNVVNPSFAVDNFSNFYKFNGSIFSEIEWRNEWKSNLWDKVNTGIVSIVENGGSGYYFFSDVLGICYYNSTTNTFRRTNYKAESYYFANSVFGDSANGIWTVNYFDMLNANGSAVKVFADSSLHTNGITFTGICKDKFGGLWLSSTSGIWRFMNRMLLRVDGKKWRKNEKINHIVADRSGNIWAACSNSGLVKIVPAEGIRFFETSFTTQNSEPSISAFNSLVVDNYNRIWAFHNLGLYIILQSPGGNIKFVVPNFDEYVRDNVATNTMPFLSGNKIWVNGVNGLFCIAADEKLNSEVDTTYPAPVITNIYVKGIGNLTDSNFNGLKLSHLQNGIRIDFSTLNFNEQGGKIVEYKLDGVDGKFTKVNGDYLSFTDLHPGSYILHLRRGIIGVDQNKNPEIIFEFFIQPPWYRTSVALFCWILISIALISFAFFKRVAQLRAKAAMQKLVVESELKALRSQLNPHFVQNTFNLIALQVSKNNSSKQIETIKKVSNYLRNVLYRSEKSISSLEEELDYVTEYLQVQQMIAPELFSFNIDVEENVDTFGILVPTMFLQPIVENSLKHGFLNMQTGGFINIVIKMEQGFVVIKISDNGRGMSTGIKSEIKNSQSKGIELTRRRLELLQTKDGQKFVEIYVTNNGAGGGAMVTIRFKMNTMNP